MIYPLYPSSSNKLKLHPIINDSHQRKKHHSLRVQVKYRVFFVMELKIWHIDIFLLYFADEVYAN